MVECAITYCDEAAVKAVQNGGVRIHVCNDHGGVYDAIPAATPKCSADGSTGTSEHYRGGA
jgi:creatinine amidohydrolase/Fe(II)-dependent formamide hydrolase-like protein